MMADGIYLALSVVLQNFIEVRISKTAMLTFCPSNLVSVGTCNGRLASCYGWEKSYV